MNAERNPGTLGEVAGASIDVSFGDECSEDTKSSREIQDYCLHLHGLGR